MSSERFVIRRLAFTGPGKDMRDVEFDRGFNIIWGASNAGKSFTVKALDYMFGGGALLPEIKEREGFTQCWLEIELPKNGLTTINRSLSGGNFSLFGGAIDQALGTTSDRTLAAQHTKNQDSLSGFLLDEMNIQNVQVATNLAGRKVSFTIRHFAHYLFTEETPMMAEWSPIKIDSRSSDAFDKSVLKFILTGTDDKELVTGQTANEQRTANVGKIEIVDEMISATTAELEQLFPSEKEVATLDLDAQLSRIDRTLTGFKDTLTERLENLDALVKERRALTSEREELIARVEEVDLTVERFTLLATVYDSDIDRLLSLQEGAAALLAGRKRPCVLCGALPEHHDESHGFAAVETSQLAVHAELLKVRAERSGLARTTTSLVAEAAGLRKKIQGFDAAIETVEDALGPARDQEANARADYERIDDARQKVRDALSIQRRLQALKLRRDALSKFRVSKRADAIKVGVSGPLGFEFATTVQAILREWRFPGEPVVSFDDRTHDIKLNGTDRRSNGKGVRALMNAAFKIGVLMFCREKGLPHPGIVVLDSPLLSYRDPHTSRHGALSPDEEVVRAANLNTHFYKYLLDRSQTTQFILIENDAPTIPIPDPMKVITFSGPTSDVGRRGLF